jgi:xanthine dehydrogenase accessory factor
VNDPHTLIGGADPIDVAEEVVAVLRGHRDGPAALATVTSRSGSAPQIIGAKLILRSDGAVVGTVGGGAIEAKVLDACRSALRDGRSRLIEANLVRDLAMCCGGSMEVFVEYLQPALRLFILGGGHVAQAIAPIAKSAGFRVHVFDDREEILDSPAFEDVRTADHDVDDLPEALADITDRDYVLIITRDHQRDERALAQLLRKPHRYLGMIGSRRKIHTVLARILRRDRALGKPDPDFSRVRAPIGLALGGRTPGEIAVSVVAELIAVRHGGSGETMNIIEDVVPKLEEPQEAG